MLDGIRREAERIAQSTQTSASPDQRAR